ncbi:MAG: response regulator transcription factor [Saccharofermentanales bacterium]
MEEEKVLDVQKNSKIRVLLADDHEMVRMGLKAYISTDDSMEVVGEASNGRQAVALAAALKPDVVLMDLLMEEMNGIEATAGITEACRKSGADTKVIILTSFIEEDKVMPALEAGAFSYLLKTSGPEDILRAIRKAFNGESVLEGKVSQVMIRSTRKVKAKHDLLTDREMEILCEIGRGKTNKEISECLYIGIKTVKTHVSSILAKLELEDRTKAAVYAVKNGLSD